MKKIKNGIRSIKEVFNTLSKSKKVLIVVIGVLALGISIQTTMIVMSNDSVDQRKVVSKNISKKKDNEKVLKKEDTNREKVEEREDVDKEIDTVDYNEEELNTNSSSNNSFNNNISNNDVGNNITTNSDNIQNNVSTNSQALTINEREILLQMLSREGHTWDYNTEEEAKAEQKDWINRGFGAGYGWDSVGSLTAYYVYVYTPSISDDCGKVAHYIDWKNTSRSIDMIDYLVQVMGDSCSGRCSLNGNCY